MLNQLIKRRQYKYIPLIMHDLWLCSGQVLFIEIDVKCVQFIYIKYT